MKLSIFCSNKDHPVYPWLQRWKSEQEIYHCVELIEKRSELSGGDILFLISCHEIMSKGDRERYKATLVIHASDLPIGRGWSPYIYQILNGQNEIMLTLLEAEDDIDSGAIWTQRKMTFEGHELVDEINRTLFKIELELMNYAVEHFGKVNPRYQDNRKPTYYSKRKPDDSRIDPMKSIAEQFELLRVADLDRYPAFFNFRGHQYIIRIEKMG